MERVIATAHRSRAAVKRTLQIGMQRIVDRLDFDRPASNAQVCFRLNAVVLRINRERAATHVYEAFLGVRRLARLHAVGTCRNRDIARTDFHRIFAVKAILDGVDLNGSAIDNQVILRVDPMAIISQNIERARPIDREVARRIHARVCIFVRIGRSVGKYILRTVGQCDEAFIRRLNIDGKTVRTRNLYTVKNNLNLIVFAGRYHNRAIGQISRHNIGSRSGNRYRGVLRHSARPRYARRIPRERYLGCRRFIKGSIHVALGIFKIEGGDIKRGRNFLETRVFNALPRRASLKNFRSRCDRRFIGIGRRTAHRRKKQHRRSATRKQQPGPAQHAHKIGARRRFTTLHVYDSRTGTCGRHRNVIPAKTFRITAHA